MGSEHFLIWRVLVLQNVSICDKQLDPNHPLHVLQKHETLRKKQLT